MSTTPTGPTQTIFKHAGDVDSQLVKPPTPGFYFWRICVQNTSKDTTAFEIQGGPGGSVPSSAPPPTLQSGPIVVLPPNGLVCGDPEAGSTANRVGTSTTQVLWFNQEYGADGNQIGPWGFNGPTGLPSVFDQVTAASINDFVAPIPQAYTLLMCVQNTSNTTAQLNYNLLGGSQ